MTNVFKVTLMVIDHDELGPKQIEEVIQNQKFPNWCISPVVMDMESRDIGPWHDEHPLNRNGQWMAFKDLFQKDEPND